MGTTAAVLALAIAAVLWWRRRAPKLVALLALVAGAGLNRGLFGNLQHQVLTWTSDLVGRLTSSAVGVAVPGVLGVVLLIAYAHDMWPKHRATGATAAIGLMLPAVALSMPGTAGSISSAAIHMVSSGVGDALMALFGGGK